MISIDAERASRGSKISVVVCERKSWGAGTCGVTDSGVADAVGAGEATGEATRIDGSMSTDASMITDPSRSVVCGTSTPEPAQVLALSAGVVRTEKLASASIGSASALEGGPAPGAAGVTAPESSCAAPAAGTGRGATMGPSLGTEAAGAGVLVVGGGAVPLPAVGTAATADACGGATMTEVPRRAATMRWPVVGEDTFCTCCMTGDWDLMVGAKRARIGDCTGRPARSTGIRDTRWMIGVAP